jgi:hypothetical protein
MAYFFAYGKHLCLSFVAFYSSLLIPGLAGLPPQITTVSAAPSTGAKVFTLIFLESGYPKCDPL